MVSKRQKLARKRFKEANPNLFPKAEPSNDPSANPKKKKKKNSRKKINGALKGKLSKRSGSQKHPLRVPGMRPGESCFICKSEDHIAKLCPEKAQWERNKICLFCRQRGHSLKNCPEKSDSSSQKKFCYNCGEVGHSLSKCPKPLKDGGSKFASCFICKEQGHLSKNCPKNAHGIYPKGGSCKICGGVTHLAKFCPNKGNNDLTYYAKGENIGSVPGENLQGVQSIHRSGDDIEDDFLVEESKSGKKDAPLHSNKEPAAGMMGGAEKNAPAKPKIKKGPKVVNFLG